ncbi:hypothetical protein ACX27_27390 [Nostoc piscinale CENA21]|uniref:Uncharacterized protein n=2 Tax=Nostoc TaxID=1177 RepID=A0A0M4T5W2_9NOSO|nr:hypothetical protein ACX27_27390 [Nostoc piscinale CENA21]
MREIQLTAGAIASYAETRSPELPFSSDWVASRIGYLDVKLQLAEEINCGSKDKNNPGTEQGR